MKPLTFLAVMALLYSLAAWMAYHALGAILAQVLSVLAHVRV